MMKNPFFPEINGKFGFGIMRLPMNGDQIDIPATCEMVDYFLDNGFNYFDTAHGYHGGASETTLKTCLTSRYPRDRYILTDKLSTAFFNKQEDIRPLFEEQLKACGVDYFDFYLMHCQDGPLYEKYRRCNAYETALELKAEGKFRHFGISFHDNAALLERILTDWPQIEVVQIQFNYADFEDASVESRKVYEVAEKFGKPVIAMEPVKGGSLVNLPEAAQKIFDDLNDGMSNASYAIRFAAGFPNMAMVLSGMSNMEQMKDNVGYMKNFKPLSDRERAAVDAVCEVYRGMNIIPCTGCRYCVLENHCSKTIRIPEIFACYNKKKIFRNWNQDFYYDSILTHNSGKASDCLGCGKCEKVCPQHLPIRSLLKDVAAEFEKEDKQ